MKPKKRLLSLLLCVTMLFSLCPQSVSAEGSTGTACTHEHTDDCYMEVTECVHEHDENCYPKMEDSVSENDASPSNATKREPDNCPHICTEESGCIVRTLNCLHEHDEDCASSSETAAPAEGTEGDDTIQTATDSNGNYEINADTLAIEKVKAMIDALPDASELEGMSEDELSEVHEKAQDAYDAFEALTDEQQAELTEELVKLRDVLEYLTGLTESTATSGTVEGFSYRFGYGICKYCNQEHPVGNVIFKSAEVSNGNITLEFYIKFKALGNCNYADTPNLYDSSNPKILDGYSYVYLYEITKTFSCTNSFSYDSSYEYVDETTKPSLRGVRITRSAGHNVATWTSAGNGKHSGYCSLCKQTVTENCSGGTATCKDKAVCSKCSTAYGSTNNNHSWGEWTANSGTHSRTCSLCTKTESGNCSGGTATCTSKAVCSTCKKEYGNLNSNNHSWGAWTSNGNGTHIRKCTLNEAHTDTANCSGGTANCTDKAVCSVCKGTYGDVSENAHDWGSWTSDGNGKHTRTCSHNSNHKETENCSGGNATCAAQAVCTTCNTAYGSTLEHNYTYTANAEQHSITESCDRGCNHSATVTLSAPTDLTYDGKAKEAVVTGSFKNVTAPTVTYNTDDEKAPTKVGDYTASITAGGQSVSVDFTIAKKSTTATVTVNGTYTYKGEQIKPTNVTVTDGDGKTIDEKEYTLSYGENTNAGTGTVTATFDKSDSYTVTNSPVSGTFTIDPKPLTDAMISVTGNFTYDGDPKSPTVTVTDGGKTLILDTDYTISGDESGTAAKTYTLTVTGKGNYGGNVGKNWIIGNATLTGISVEQDGKLTYTVLCYT